MISIQCCLLKLQILYIVKVKKVGYKGKSNLYTENWCMLICLFINWVNRDNKYLSYKHYTKHTLYLARKISDILLYSKKPKFQNCRNDLKNFLSLGNNKIQTRRNFRF